MPFDGYPDKWQTPRWIQLLMWPMKKWVLSRGFPAGVRVPGVEGRTFGTEACEVDEGLARLRTSFRRLAAEAPTQASPAFGPMTQEECIQFHLRHAELHLGYFHAR